MPAVNCSVTKLSARHMTDSGVVHLEARKQAGTWVARFRGPELKLGHRFKSAGDACCYLQMSFSRHFPKHRCTAACWA